MFFLRLQPSLVAYSRLRPRCTWCKTYCLSCSGWWINVFQVVAFYDLDMHSWLDIIHGVRCHRRCPGLPVLSLSRSYSHQSRQFEQINQSCIVGYRCIVPKLSLERGRERERESQLKQPFTFTLFGTQLELWCRLPLLHLPFLQLCFELLGGSTLYGFRSILVENKDELALCAFGDLRKVGSIESVKLEGWRAYSPQTIVV